MTNLQNITQKDVFFWPSAKHTLKQTNSQQLIEKTNTN